MSTIGLLLAGGPATHLVGRPASRVAHAHVGPLTPSGRWAPAAARTVCGVRTRRLRVLSGVARGDAGDGRRGCLRCWVRLNSGWRTQQTRPREDWVAAYAGVTAFDLAVATYRADTIEDVELLEFLALLLVDWRDLHKAPVVSHTGKVTKPLAKQLARARVRVGGVRAEVAARAELENEIAAAGVEARKARARQARDEREERIQRLGFINGTRRPA